MRVKNWLAKATGELAAAGVVTARLDALVLLEDETKKDRAWLLANPDTELTSKELKKLKTKLKRRVLHEPLAYIRGKTEFYGREFLVSKDTLEPRPESETMIDQLKKIVNPDEKLVLADIGTGSGALAITAKLELPNLTVYGTEISETALTIAKQNAKLHNVSAKLLQGNLLVPLEEAPDILISNLPYVPDGHTINKAAMQEPTIAIFGGYDGLELYRQLFVDQLKQLSWRPKYILTESLPPQHEEMANILASYRYLQRTEDDFIQVFRLTTD